MIKVIHAKGKAITLSEKSNNAYLIGKMCNHTGCGYLFDSTEKNEKRLSWDNSEVTCKNCLKQLDE